MINISEELYRKLASKLIEVIGEKEYVNTRFVLEEFEFNLEFEISLIIFRYVDTTYNVPVQMIKDIVPVWYSVTIRNDIFEIENDFNWNEFKNYLL